MFRQWIRPSDRDIGHSIWVRLRAHAFNFVPVLAWPLNFIFLGKLQPPKPQFLCKMDRTSICFIELYTSNEIMHVATLTSMTHLSVIPLSLECPEEGKSYNSVFLEYVLTPYLLLPFTTVSEFSLVKPLDNWWKFFYS